VATNEPRAHLIYLSPAGVLLVKRPDADWRQLQGEYEGFITSFGPWSAEDIIEHFARHDGGDDSHWPFEQSLITRFMAEPNWIELEGRPVK
jgi:hypothetical protein